MHQFNLTLQRQLPWEIAVTGAFVGSYRRDEVTSLQINNAPPGPGSIASRRPFRNVFPNVGGIAFTMNAGTTDYRAVHVLLEADGSTGVGARARRIRSKSDGTQPNGQYPFSSIPSGTNPFPRSTRCHRLRERTESPTASASGTSGQDIRHRMVISFNYELPFAAKATGATAVLAKGWQVNVISVMQSGTHFTITNASARSNTGGGDQPIRSATPSCPKASAA